MRKIILFIIVIFLISGCSANNTNVIKEFKTKVEKAKSYTLSGAMELNGDEETFSYDIEVNFLKDNYYKVNMINKSNNHEQIILKNSDGLYVITPSLNKSFKFESTWPDNASQAYILESLIKDIENDKETSVTKDNGYVIKCKVNYPNNDNLSYEKIYLDENYNIEKVEVYSDADLVKINVEFKDVKLNSGLKKNDFILDEYINSTSSDKEESKETMSKIETAIYPLYTPSNTYLTSSELINNDESNRVILTFSGDKNYVLVEETSVASEEHEIIPVYGEPLMLENTIAALEANSMYWTSNDINYYLLSNDLSISEMVFIATSLENNIATIAEK